MDYKKFIDEQIGGIRKTVGDKIAINALSGGVDGSIVMEHRLTG